MMNYLRRLVLPVLFVSLLFSGHLKAQQQEPALVSGPMLGYSEHRSVIVWFEVSQSVRSAMLRYWEKDNTSYFYEMDYLGQLEKPYNPIRFELVKLKLNTTYNYVIS